MINSYILDSISQTRLDLVRLGVWAQAMVPVPTRHGRSFRDIEANEFFESIDE